MSPLLLCVIVALALLAIGLIGKTKSRTSGRYRKKKSLLTHAEIDFFKTLQEATSEFAVYTKVRMSDVIEATDGNHGSFLRISQKHFDWIICNPYTLEPLAAIELDDASHTEEKAINRDATKNAAAASAGLPLIRFKWQKHYHTDQVARKINEALKEN